jgi:hypothetical protein
MKTLQHTSRVRESPHITSRSVLTNRGTRVFFHSK